MNTKLNLTQSYIIALAIAFLVSSASADVQFPVFQAYTNTLVIPTNMAGFLMPTNGVSGASVQYQVRGQVFVAPADGQIASPVTNIVGTTDKSTPWKTVTELLSAYKHGCNSNDLASLYTLSSKPFFDSIYTNSGAQSRFISFASAITNMTVLFGFEVGTTGYLAITSLKFSDEDEPDTYPLYFDISQTSSNSVYKLDVHEAGSPMEQNISLYVNSVTVSNIVTSP